MNRKGEMNVNNFVGIALVAGFFIFLWNGGYLQGITGGEAPVSQPITVAVEGACGVDSTTLTAHIVKKNSEATSMAAENVTIVLNGAEKITKLHGASTTVSPGDIVDLYNGFYSATYYTTHARGTIPCSGAVLTSQKEYKGQPVFLPADAYKLTQMEAATTSMFTVINSDGTSTNPGTAQALGIGATKNLKVQIAPTYEDGWGIVDGLVVNCQYNTSAYADSSQDAVRISRDGKALTLSTRAPSNTLETATSTDHSRIAYEMAGIDGKTTSQVDLIVSIKADETNDPNGGGGDLNCTIYDTDYFKTDDGQFKIGIEDSDDNSNVGLTEGIAHKFGVKVS